MKFFNAVSLMVIIPEFIEYWDWFVLFLNFCFCMEWLISCTLRVHSFLVFMVLLELSQKNLMLKMLCMGNMGRLVFIVFTRDVHDPTLQVLYIKCEEFRRIGPLFASLWNTGLGWGGRVKYRNTIFLRKQAFWVKMNSVFVSCASLGLHWSRFCQN